MKILIITPFYSPDNGPSAPLFTLLSEGLVKKGHQVSVIAAVPHYPTGRVALDFKKKGNLTSIENGVEITRVRVPSLDRNNFIHRIIQLICYQFWATIKSFTKKCDVVLITNPALETWLPTIWHSVIRKKTLVFSVFDVYPDVGIKLGIFKNKWIINLVSLLERSCLKPAAAVQIISDSFRESLSQLGVPDSKIKLIPIWVDDQLIQPLPKANRFSKEFGLTDKFIILYAGNIGLSQGLDSVLQAARLLEKEQDIQFIFVGDGTAKADLQAKAEKQELRNVQFIPFQPRESLPEVLASADISLISLKRQIGEDSLPSKTYSALASGRPIIASVDEDSELAKLIEQADAGITIPVENADALADAITTLKKDEELCIQFSENGRRYIEQHHSVSHAVDNFTTLFTQIIK
jgi:colanic acid biosynthesis glycosyl transferase WcaI